MGAWLNPSNEMLEGRNAGRGDRQREIDDLQFELDSIQEELDELKAKLPTTADGVPVVPGMMTYCGEPGHFAHHWDLRLKTGEAFAQHCKRQDERHYSTREAAEAARSE